MLNTSRQVIDVFNEQAILLLYIPIDIGFIFDQKHV